ncbi:mediator of DNA damage checkpoint protein 1 isoform X2 [Tyto alba]|uniref:mediator of DNA damage checkpoint protein 1 isoform X2 n=1 Tax=Tyto alba TaxID=56313 RepID=UPI001C67B4EA|nr:mediator of DNA damage checkpoint protein 1 isoform X2 [Tyto alba]
MGQLFPPPPQTMHRRHHQDLSTVGNTGQRLEPGPPLASDSEDDEVPRRLALRGAASPRVVLESDPEEPDVHPAVPRPRKRCRTRPWGHLPDVATPCPDPNIGGPKKRRFGPKTTPDPDVGRKTAVPNVQPLSQYQNPPKVAGSDVDPDVDEKGPNPDVGGAENGCQMLVVDSDTDVKEADFFPNIESTKMRQMAQNAPNPPGVEVKPLNPDVGGPKKRCRTFLVDSDTDVEEMESSNSAVEGPKNGHQMLVVDSDTDVEEDRACPSVSYPQNIPKVQDIEMETHNADVEGSQEGHPMLMVDSDTDVEENGANPDVGYREAHQRTQTVAKPQTVEVAMQNADVQGSQKGHRVLMVESDTDVEEDTSNPDVGCPESHRTAPRDPEVKAKTTNQEVEGGQTLLVESDTDVEEDTSNPDVGIPKTHQATQNVPRNPHVETKRPNPHVDGPQSKHCTLVVDSDTDVEENEVDPDVRCPKTRIIAHKDPDVDIRTPNPDVKGTQNEHWILEVDSDTDVEDDNLNQGPKSHKTPQNTQKHPTVVMETPNPDVGSLSRDSVASSGDSDTDVEDLSALANAAAPKLHVATHEVTATAAPDVDPEGRMRTNDNPDVDALFPNPDVGAPKAQCPVLNVDNDADVEDSAVIPDVGTPQGCRGAPGAPDVVATSPNPDVPPPTSPRHSSDTDVEEVAPTPDVPSRVQFQDAPTPDVVSRIQFQDPPPPDVVGPATGGAAAATDPNRCRSSPERQSFPLKSVPAPQAPPQPGATWGVAADAEGGAGATGAAVTESDTEDDPDLFLEPTQNFLSPVAKGAAPAWDPEEPTQPFWPPKEKEEEEEEEEEQPPPHPPQDPPSASVPPTEPVVVTPAQEGTAELGAGPRRSQRLARNRGGGATGGGASGKGGASKGRGGVSSVTAPPRRSPRLQPHPPPAAKGRGQAESCPPAKPRPCRAGPAPSQKQAEKEDKQLPEVTRPHLRPREAPGSAPPKVLFTAVVASPAMEVALRTLGGSMATSVFDCTHLVTDRVRRTVKFLCAVARGIPIVTPEWLHKSSHSGHVLAPDPFLVRDNQQERHFGFSLAQALRRARCHPLLQGYEVHVTPNVRPEPEHMRDIVTCSGGTFLPTMPHTYGPRRLVISCEADAGCWAPALGARLPLASAELLLTGLLRQRLQLGPFLLTPPPSGGAPPNPAPHVPTGRHGALRHPPANDSGEVTARGRSRGTPRGSPRHPPGTRRRPAAPPTRQ